MVSSDINKVVILYNPNSTGDGKKNAEDLMSELAKASKKLKVELKKTEYPGHAEEIAQQYVKSVHPVLLISSSGDGGYHELVNGVLLNKAKGVFTGLLPSGNANDHHGAVGTNSLVEHILSGTSKKIDVLKIISTVNGKPWVRYAHSYAGIGLTSEVGKELTKEKLNFFNEKWLTLKHLLTFRHVSIELKGKRVRYDSLIFSNIHKMSKVIQLSKDSSISDGRFEVNAVPHRSKLYLISQLFRAVTIGLEENSSVSFFEFRTIKKLLIQLDGEDFTLDAHSDVKVESLHNTLSIIV